MKTLLIGVLFVCDSFAGCLVIDSLTVQPAPKCATGTRDVTGRIKVNAPSLIFGPGVGDTAVDDCPNRTRAINEILARIRDRKAVDAPTVDTRKPRRSAKHPDVLEEMA